MSYSRVADSCERTHRVGGWRYLLGDAGSGYAIGRDTLRQVLHSLDIHRMQAGDDQAATDLEAIAHVRDRL